MFYAVGKEYDTKSWKGCIAVIPTASVGNVSQLAIDLIISTLKLSKVGYLYDDSLLPIIGNDPFSQKTTTELCNLVTGCEVYGSKEKNIVVIQIRSQIIKEKRTQFRQRFSKWANEAEFSDVIILAGSFAHLRVDKQLVGSQLRYLPGKGISENLKKKIENSNYTHLEPIEDSELFLKKRDDRWKDEIKYAVPGGGGAKHLLDQCFKDNLSSLCLLIFCSEGNNSIDAVKLADFLNSVVCLVPEVEKVYDEKETSIWQIPSSWKLLYGNLPDKSIF